MRSRGTIGSSVTVTGTGFTGVHGDVRRDRGQFSADSAGTDHRDSARRGRRRAVGGTTRGRDRRQHGQVPLHPRPAPVKEHGPANGQRDRVRRRVAKAVAASKVWWNGRRSAVAATHRAEPWGRSARMTADGLDGGDVAV